MKKVVKKDAITAYKVFDQNWMCRAYQFVVGKIFKHDGPVVICESGFHACLKLAHCFSYYDFDPTNKVAEVRIWGDVDEHSDDSKICGSQIEIVREIEWVEVLVLANGGKNNSGHSNSGNWNSGNRNSGDQNSGYRNSGGFCTDQNPYITLFDKPTDIKVLDWEQHPAVKILENNLETHIFVWASSMTDAEKEAHPHWETTEGYLKSISLKEAWANMWPNLDEASREVFLMLPNFDAVKFEEITGIKVETDK